MDVLAQGGWGQAGVSQRLWQAEEEGEKGSPLSLRGRWACCLQAAPGHRGLRSCDSRGLCELCACLWHLRDNKDGSSAVLSHRASFL